MKLTKKGDAGDALMKNVRKLLKQNVYVGIPEEAADRAPKPDEPTPASNALIAYVLDRGSPARNIPARPFLVPGIESAKTKIAEQMKKGVEAAFTGNADGINTAQNAAGLIAQSAVKAYMSNNLPPPLAPATLDERKRRGVSRTNTLVDTGALRNAITYVIRPRVSS